MGFGPVAVVGQGAQSITDHSARREEGQVGGNTQGHKGERKNGENKVFPIQVSRQELFLFLGCCYFYKLQSKHSFIWMPKIICTNYHIFSGLNDDRTRSGQTLPKNTMNEGKKSSPSRSIAKALFLLRRLLFLFFAPLYQLHAACQI